MNEEYSDVTMVTDKEALRPQHGSTENGSLVMIYGEFLGRRFTIESTSLLLGRSPDCEIQLADDCVSRMHCRVFGSSDGAMVTDLNSTNGTYVNATAVSTRPLQDGDRLKIGRSIFKFLSGDNIEQAYHEEIYRLKTTDGLTGAFNKRFFEEEIEREHFRFLRYKRPLSLLMMDIDHFKRVNDDYGHLAGDRVLSQLGTLVAGNIRREDTFCRYGGEEFSVLMPEMDLSTAAIQAERLRKLVSEATFEFEGLALPVTISIGVAAADATMSTPSDFIKLADQRLYEAKQAGRNQVIPLP